MQALPKHRESSGRSEVFSGRSDVLFRLREAKRLSDLRDYRGKHAIMAQLIAQRGNEFHIDSEDGKFVGLTHKPTNFRIHVPTRVAAPLRVQVPQMKTANDKEVFVRPAILGGLLAGSAVPLYYSWRLRQQLKELQKTKKNELKKILKALSLPKDLQAARIPAMENAFYAEPDSAAEVAQFYNLTRLLNNPKIRKRLDEHGLIGYGDSFDKPAIIAHEAGHAQNRLNHKWYHPRRFNQSWLYPLSLTLGPLAGSAVGAATGLITENPLYGAAAGLGVGGLLGAPALIAEYQASAAARDYLRGSGMPQAEQDKSNRALSTAYKTYLGSALAGPTASGLLGGFAGMANS